PAPAPAASSALHLELGRVYLRFGDARAARTQLDEAARLAANPGERAQAYSSLAQLAEAAGDRSGAIAALERAVGDGGDGGGEAAARLGRLYLDARRWADAEALYGRRLAQARDPWQRDELLRLELELFRRAGTLAARVA